MSWFEGLGIDRGGRKQPKRTLEEDDGSLPIVGWIPIICPSCGSKRQTNYRTSGLIRFHRCQLCGQRFKSQELDPGALSS